MEFIDQIKGLIANDIQDQIQIQIQIQIQFQIL